MKAIQRDVLSIPARNFVPYILATMAGDTNATIQQALGILAAWNYTELRSLVAPLIFEVWYDMFEQNTFADEFGPFGLFPFPNIIIPLWNMTQTAASNPYAITLFDDKNTPSAGPGQPGWETMPDIINRSLHDAIDWITSQLGSNMSNWQYGNLHTVHFNHPMGSFLPYFNVPQTPVGCDGSAYTVNPGSHFHYLIVIQTYLFVENGASYRGIYECKDGWNTSLILVPPGESGNVTGTVFAPVFDPHCTDTFLMWLNYQYTPCLFNDTAIQSVYEMKIVFYGVQLRGDINDDGIVDITDLVIVALAFGSQPVDDPNTPWDETKNWNPDADINGDGIIDIVDLVIIGVTFGERLPGDC
jgi:acyl-homoserine lactone acylase PvdQ